MKRLPDLLLPENKAYGDRNEPTLSLKYGGQFGYAPDLSEWVSNQTHVKSNAVVLLLEAPKFMSIMDTPPQWYAALRALVEVHAKSVTGFNAGLEVSVNEQEVGGGGEMQQAYTDVKRERTIPVFNWVDKDGNVIQRFLEYWIRFGLMDPDSKIPMATTRKDYGSEKDWLADWYAMTIMVIEPNTSMTVAMRTWITTNMWPLSTGEISAKREMATEQEIVDISITFSGLSDTSIGTNICGQTMLDAIYLQDANPWLRKCFVSTQDENVKSTDADVGFQHGVEEIVKQSIPPR